jgi:hypothetical protein
VENETENREEKNSNEMCTWESGALFCVCLTEKRENETIKSLIVSKTLLKLFSFAYKHRYLD